MRNWLYRLLWTLNTTVLTTRASEAFREIAILWLVFSMLDKLIADDLTASWILAQGSIAVVLWALGLYLELRRIE